MKKHNDNIKKLIIFDLDNTLYQLKGGTFNESLLNKKIQANAVKFISKKLNIPRKKAKTLLEKIIQKRGENISIALEKMFNIDRHEYFNTVWNIKADKYIIKGDDLNSMFSDIRQKFDFVLVSDAPLIWIKSVLKSLKILEVFKEKIYSGEGDNRKIFYNTFDNILHIYNKKPKDCIAIGDQEDTDIIPAKKLGITTILINKNQKSSFADFIIKDIRELPKIIKGN